MDSPASRAADQRAVWFAMGSCLAMIAYHVGSKAVRDALFLSWFDVTSLPTMVIVAALFSIVCVMGCSRLMSRIGPATLVPAAFTASGFLQIAVWIAIEQHPRACAVLVYLQTVALGSILTSGFWSVINERFDPRTAKQHVGRIAGAGTLGGLIGGVVAERIAAHFSLPVMLPVLASYHFLCALMLQFVRDQKPEAPRREETAEQKSGWNVLQQAPYLRTLAALVILGTISAAMLDYVFKAQALATYGKGENLLRFFALFYSVTGVVTFLLQAAMSAFALKKLGMARTVGMLPMAMTFGGIGALIVQGLPTVTIARGFEAVIRGSLFRAGYELFYAPMPVHEKRAAKSVVDVGFDRLGDAVGGLVVKLLLAVIPAFAISAILGAAIVVSLAGVYVATRLRGAYLDALEHGLRDRVSEMAGEEIQPEVGLTGFADSMTMVNPSTLLSAVTYVAKPAPPRADGPVTTQPKTDEPSDRPGPGATTAMQDQVLQQIAALRSGSATQVRRFLLQNPEPKNYHIPHLLTLLGWDRVANEVVLVLRMVAERNAGQLIDALLDPATDFAIRRRLPRVIASCPNRRVANALVMALNDKRFEVRFQCGRALQTVQQANPSIRFDAEELFGAIRREVAVSKPVWDSHRLLDRSEESEGAPFMDELLRDRTNRSLQHLFNLLALVLPPEPLKIAFQGLHTDDAHLRGTALEYLESILPPDIRHRLWPLLEPGSAPKPPHDSRPREEIIAELIKSNQSIIVRLEELNKKAQ